MHRIRNNEMNDICCCSSLGETAAHPKPSSVYHCQIGRKTETHKEGVHGKQTQSE